VRIPRISGRATGLGVLTLSLGLVLPSVALLASAAPAAADSGTLYVDNENASCSDTAAASGTQAVPFCTIQAAALVVQAGQTVQVARGVYSGAVTVTHSGTPGHPIVFKGDAGQENDSTLDLDAQPNAYQRGAAFVLQGVHDVTLQGFRYDDGAVSIEDSSDISVLHSFSAEGPFLVQGASANVTLSGLYIYAQTDNGGIWVGSGASATTITGDLVEVLYSTIPAGISLLGSPDSTIVANTVVQAPGTGIAISGDSHGTTVENNLVSGTGSGGTTGLLAVSAASTTGTTVDYNLLGPVSTGAPYNWAGTTYSTVAAFNAGTGQGTHDLFSAGVNTLRRVDNRSDEPFGSSPAIDSGNAAAPGEPARDVYGDVRAVQDPLIADVGAGGAPVDRGAVEAQNPYTFDFDYPGGALDPADPLSYTTAVHTTSNPWNTKVASYLFSFGDGSAAVSTALPTVTHTFPLSLAGQTAFFWAEAVLPDGERIPTTDSQGLFSDDYTPISPLAPLAASVSTTPSAPQTETLKVQNNTYLGAVSVDPGDGTAAITAPVPAHSTTATVVHHYAKAGSYTATTTVTDLYGRTATVKQTVVVPAAAPKATTAPKITGTAQVGKVLTVNHGTWTPTPSSYAYQWYRNGVAIKGATKSTHTATATDKGKKLTVRVTAELAGHTNGTAISKAAAIS
jgi:parallel beta-helix repeat protein